LFAHASINAEPWSRSQVVARGENRLQSSRGSTTQSPDASGPVLVGAAVLAVSGLITGSLVELGPLSLQMLQHLALMNVVAPLVALSLNRSGLVAPTSLLLAGFAQLVALWVWHAPAVQHLAASSSVAQVALMSVLAGAAIWFWSALVRASQWRGLIALLLTGKLACLLGALLIFAPRDLYNLDGLVLALCTTGPSNLADQQLAGLLMITACPLSYLVTGVALAARMLARLDSDRAIADANASAR
jgi:putative membrane protein